MTVPSAIIFLMLVIGCEVCSAQWFRRTDAGGGRMYTPAPRFHQFYANLTDHWLTTTTSTVVTTTSKQIPDTMREDIQPEGKVYPMFEVDVDDAKDDTMKEDMQPEGRVFPIFDVDVDESEEDDDDDEVHTKKDIKDAGVPKVESKKGGLNLKKYYKYMLPLLLAYKLKFFTLVPLLVSGLVLIAGSTGLAGFFFALFAAVMGIKGGSHH